jgi:hypothetical protein
MYMVHVGSKFGCIGKGHGSRCKGLLGHEDAGVRAVVGTGGGGGAILLINEGYEASGRGERVKGTAGGKFWGGKWNVMLAMERSSGGDRNGGRRRRLRYRDVMLVLWNNRKDVRKRRGGPGAGGEGFWVCRRGRGRGRTVEELGLQKKLMGMGGAVKKRTERMLVLVVLMLLVLVLVVLVFAAKVVVGMKGM